jgi:site-specific recombinase XerD
MSNKSYTPVPVFDTMQDVIDQHKACATDDNPKQFIREWLNHCFENSSVTLPQYVSRDYQCVLNFLYSYRGSQDTFTAYRRELERLLQWSWFVREQSVLKHSRDDVEAFVEFCIKPYKRWIGVKNVARFKLINGKKTPNTEWRPFTASISKTDRYTGESPDKNDYQCSQQALKVMFGIISSFYNYLLQDEIVSNNPVLLLRQKSRFIRKEATIPIVRRLSDQQWQTVIHLAKANAEKDPQEERTVFILSCLYSMYLRISELVTSARWSPSMGDFFKDNDNHWWFKTVGKGNKARQIAVSDAMLAALKHYRTTYLNLSPYPLIGEKIPLIGHKDSPNAPITSTRPIRRLVQMCFDEAADALESRGDKHEATLLRTATVHWLRHTGISEDVKRRPREHVRDDAGHSSSAITDRYIDVELKERAKSAKKKPMI